MENYINIKKIREKKGITQETIAEDLKMSQSAYSRCENYGEGLTVERLIKISFLLETEIYRLIKGGYKRSRREKAW